MSNLQKVLVAFLAALAMAAPAHSQPYPSHPIRIVVPFSPGGFTDVVGRIVAQKLSEAFGQQAVIDNKAGAASIIGTEIVAKSKPDGYTLVMISTTHVIAPWMYKKLPYDALKDFAPVMKLVDGSNVAVVHPSLGVSSIAELIALAKANPGKIDYASSGNGSTQHLVAALFATMTGTQLNHVPYKGSAQATTDLIGGQVKLSFAGVPNVLQYIQNGRLRALAVTGTKRAPELPEVPTMDEAGVKGYDGSSWLGLLAPAATPREVIALLQSTVAKALVQPDAQKAIAASGVVVSTSTTEEFAAQLRRESVKWGKVVRDSGATVE